MNDADFVRFLRIVARRGSALEPEDRKTHFPATAGFVDETLALSRPGAKTPAMRFFEGSGFAAMAILVGVTGCAGSADSGAVTEDELRTPTAVVELTLDARGKCKMKSEAPRVKHGRVVRLKNVSTKPIAALVSLWDNFGGMPAPEGGDIEPGKHVSVKMSTNWWTLNDDPDSREWSTSIVCKRGPWDDDRDLDEVGEVHVFR